MTLSEAIYQAALTQQIAQKKARALEQAIELQKAA